MRIHFDNVNISSRSGPNTFAGRLARELITMGHEVIFDCQSADISLVFIEPSGAPLAKKVIQRLDGIWFKPSEFHTKNQNIEGLYRSADAVIWQSKFDQGMTLKWWGIPGRGRGQVIHNGIDTKPVTQITIPELTKIRSTFDQVFVCSSNWHSQKRLRSNLELFDHIRSNQYPNSCIIVMGSNPDVMTMDRKVMYTGSQPPEVYLQVFAIANWMFHLAWADHCPNVVIESLSQGTPVVCSSVGGTKELVDEFGIIIDEKTYDYELADYDNPPQIDVSNIKLPTKEKLGRHIDISIRTAAVKYASLFEEILG